MKIKMKQSDTGIGQGKDQQLILRGSHSMEKMGSHLLLGADIGVSKNKEQVCHLHPIQACMHAGYNLGEVGVKGARWESQGPSPLCSFTLGQLTSWIQGNLIVCSFTLQVPLIFMHRHVSSQPSLSQSL